MAVCGKVDHGRHQGRARNSAERSCAMFLKSTRFEDIKYDTESMSGASTGASSGACLGQQSHSLRSQVQENQTIIFSKANGDPLLPNKQLEQQFSKDILCVVFNEHRSWRWTGTRGPPTKTSSQRNYRENHILLLMRMRLHPHNTSHGLTADFSALCDEWNRDVPPWWHHRERG